MNRNTDELNPFVVGRYVSDEYFCDRDKETDFLITQILNGRNVALISPRRMGKTGLIHHVLEKSEIRGSRYTFFIDIYATSSLQEFVFLLGKSIHEQLRRERPDCATRFIQAVKSLQVSLKFDALTGEPALCMGFGDITSPEETIDEIFTYLEHADKRCLLVFDEFQRIGAYPEKNVEALLRTTFQHCSNVTFLCSGSQRHLMANMFFTPAKPFYQSALSMGLGPIPEEVYASFAAGWFEKRGKVLDREVVNIVYNRYEGCTWFMQMIMNELYALTAQGSVCRPDMVDAAEDGIIMSQDIVYRELFQLFPTKQKALLQAVAREGRASGMTSAKFVKKYSLGSASSVQAAMIPLLKSDVLTKEGDEVRIYDYFFAHWISKNY